MPSDLVYVVGLLAAGTREHSVFVNSMACEEGESVDFGVIAMKMMAQLNHASTPEVLAIRQKHGPFRVRILWMCDTREEAHRVIGILGPPGKPPGA